MLNNNQSQLLSMRNAYYQGYFKQEIREGPGIAILDEGTIIVCNWVKGLPQGKAFVFFNMQEYGYVQYSQGKLDSYSYVCSEKELLVIRFDKGVPVDKHLLVNYNDNSVKLLAFRNGTYQTLDQMKLEEKEQEKIIKRYLGIKMYVPTLNQFLQGQFSYEKIGFETKVLSNGSIYFRFVDQKNPLSLGFVVGKREKLVSYGSYLDGKLHGWGRKVDINLQQEGQFENGQLHGLGFSIQNHKYSFGKFTQGNLVESNAEQRGTGGHIRLKQLRKKYHIQSLHFHNSYLPKDLIGFKGISQVKARPSVVKQMLYNEQPLHSPTSSHLKGSNVSLNQILSSRMQMRQSSDLRSVFNNSSLGSSREQKRQWTQNRRWDMANSHATGSPSMRYPLE